MKQIRFGVFETNSSSTHSLELVEKEEWERFKNGESYITYNIRFAPIDCVGEEYQEYYEKCTENKRVPNDFEDWCAKQGYYTYETLFGWFSVRTKDTKDKEYVAISIYGSID